MLCISEDLIFDRQAGGNACPQCGSAAVWPVSRWLNRRPAPITLTISPAEIVELADARSLP